MAAVLKLPVVYVCQNNQYAISMPADRGLGCHTVADRAAGYGIPGLEVDGNDVLAVHEAVRGAMERAREGNGPTLIDARTFRVGGHWIADPEVYRTKEEAAEWEKRDPILLLEKKLMERGDLSEADRDRTRLAAEEEVSLALKQAEADPLPTEDLLGADDIFAPSPAER
jgi:TPP-dependent pyruvate/acetoin dehydrogenase alpha subunit